MKKDSALSFRTLVLTLDMADGFPVLARCQFEDYWFNRPTPREKFQKGGNGTNQCASAWTGL